jgi:hypothetical protein
MDLGGRIHESIEESKQTIVSTLASLSVTIDLSIVHFPQQAQNNACESRGTKWPLLIIFPALTAVPLETIRCFAR